MITFNNIPTNLRTIGVFAEIDNSQALKSLAPNPHKALIIGQKIASKTTPFDTIFNMSKNGLADGYFGAGSILARMVNAYKLNSPNMEVHAICIGSGIAGTAASASFNMSDAMVAAETGAAGTFYLMIAGTPCYVDFPISTSGMGLASLIASVINANSYLPVIAKTATGSVRFSAVCSGTLGNYIDIRYNYYAGQSLPTAFSRGPSIISMAGGTVDPSLGDTWAVIDGQQYQYIVNPYADAANLTSLENELNNRFGPMVDMQGMGFTGLRATLASATTLGLTRNSPFNTLVTANASPDGPCEWAAAWAGQASKALQDDPARPVQYLTLKGILPPSQESRFTQSERNILLYDGLATWICDTAGNIMIERSITTYRNNAMGILDPSYLDCETLATLNEIRYQYKARMASRFMITRQKLADDTFPVQPGANVVTPKTIRAEIISLFSMLQRVGLIENLDDFKNNLVVERDLTDKNRINALLPPDLINQFRIMAGLIQFIL